MRLIAAEHPMHRMSFLHLNALKVESVRVAYKQLSKQLPSSGPHSLTTERAISTARALDTYDTELQFLGLHEIAMPPVL